MPSWAQTSSTELSSRNRPNGKPNGHTVHEELLAATQGMCPCWGALDRKTPDEQKCEQRGAGYHSLATSTRAPRTKRPSLLGARRRYLQILPPALEFLQTALPP